MGYVTPEQIAQAMPRPFGKVTSAVSTQPIKSRWISGVESRSG